MGPKTLNIHIGRQTIFQQLRDALPCCIQMLDRHACYPDDEEQWLLWSPDFFLVNGLIQSSFLDLQPFRALYNICQPSSIHTHIHTLMAEAGSKNKSDCIEVSEKMTSPLIYSLINDCYHEFMVSISIFKSFSIQHDFLNYGPFRVKQTIKQSMLWGGATVMCHFG